ncbi:MAG: hypothetical protein KBT00_00045 [Bacteroidales bacterium]|nr:hypothetical protein [Candidatus Cacconaster merdequi]
MKKALSILICLLMSFSSAFSQNSLTLRAYMDAPNNGDASESYSRVLWYDEATEEYFASDTPYSKPEKLFTFIPQEGLPSRNYTTAFLPDGSVLFVYDSQFGGETYTDEEAFAPYSTAIDNKYRKNPIIAIANEGYRLQVIDFGDRLKPTGWLQNIGQHYSFRHKAFYFAEYTRANLRTCNGWMVKGDITDPDNWHVKARRPIDFPYKFGTKHFHIAQEDPYTGVVYFSTGDRNAGLYASIDGENFTQIDKNDRAKWRMLNAVFTKDYVWWASDDWTVNHRFWRCARGKDGVIDPSTLTLIYQFPFFTEGPDSRATYGNIYFSALDAILFLDRWDGGCKQNKVLPVYLYDIKAEKMIKVTDIPLTEGLSDNAMWGFRCRTMEMYPSGNEAVVSFDSFHPNELPFSREDAAGIGFDGKGPRNLKITLTKDGKGNFNVQFKGLE